MRVELFDYELPPRLIAQEPAARRDQSRLLVVERDAGAGAAQGPDPEEVQTGAVPAEHRFRDLPSLLRAGDLLVVNDARVDPVRLWARRATGGTVEVLLLRRAGAAWEAMMRPARRIRAGDRLSIIGGMRAAAPQEEDPDTGAPADSGAFIQVIGDAPGGRKLIALPADVAPAELLDVWGAMPLPPYIHRHPGDGRATLDRERYQTVYATEAGAVAAPTAGLHFTPALLEKLRGAGVEIAALTLRVGPGTFQPLRVEDVGEHVMEAEQYVLPEGCVEAIVSARRRGGRIIAVGTTVVRTLEHAARVTGGIEGAAGAGSADLFIYPGFEFRVIDAMLTNFHLPRSTPLLMVAALAGRDRLLSAYRYAVAQGFRFYSYGDAMLVL